MPDVVVGATAGGDLTGVAFAFVWLYGILTQSVLGLNTLSDYSIPDEIFEDEATNMFSSMLMRAIETADLK